MNEDVLAKVRDLAIPMLDDPDMTADGAKAIATAFLVTAGMIYRNIGGCEFAASMLYIAADQYATGGSDD